MYKEEIYNAKTGETTYIPFTDEELEARAAYMRDVYPGVLLDRVRDERNRLLAETDWWANSDVTMTDEQRAYRQALRDLPANTADPANPVFPTKPAG